MWPENGRSKAEYSDEIFKQAALASEGGLPEVVDPAAYQLARSAYSSEPLNPVALRMMALEMAESGKDEAAQRLMELTSQLSKRERVANIWLAQRFANAGENEKALSHYDMLLRTSRAAVQQIVPVLTANMADEEMVGPVAQLMRRDPPWAFVFWNRLVRTTPALANAAKLRLQLADTNISTNTESDALLVSNLIAAGQFENGLKLARSLNRLDIEQGGISNASFAALPKLAPADWELVSEGERGASIDARGDGNLLISALPGASGLVARQLVQIPNGRQSLSVTGLSGLDGGAAVMLQLSCASGESSAAVAQITATQDTDQATQFNSNCEYSWLEIAIDNSDNDAPADVMIGAVELKTGS